MGQQGLDQQQSEGAGDPKRSLFCIAYSNGVRCQASASACEGQCGLWFCRAHGKAVAGLQSAAPRQRHAWSLLRCDKHTLVHSTPTHRKLHVSKRCSTDTWLLRLLCQSTMSQTCPGSARHSRPSLQPELHPSLLSNTLPVGSENGYLDAQPRLRRRLFRECRAMMRTHSPCTACKQEPWHDRAEFNINKHDWECPISARAWDRQWDSCAHSSQGAQTQSRR